MYDGMHSHTLSSYDLSTLDCRLSPWDHTYFTVDITRFNDWSALQDLEKMQGSLLRFCSSSDDEEAACGSRSGGDEKMNQWLEMDRGSPKLRSGGGKPLPPLAVKSQSLMTECGGGWCLMIVSSSPLPSPLPIANPLYCSLSSLLNPLRSDRTTRIILDLGERMRLNLSKGQDHLDQLVDQYLQILINDSNYFPA